MAKSLSAEESAELQKLLATLAKGQHLFRRHVLPVYQDDGQGVPTAFGTALVAEQRGTTFLVSAKHVLRPPKGSGDLYVYSNPDQKRFLGGKLAVTNSDSVDVGVLRLEGEGLPPYPEVGCIPLPSSQMVPNAGRVQGRYFFAVGYPATKSKANKQSKTLAAQPYGNFGPALSAERMTNLELDPDVHFGISFHKKRVFGMSGKVESSPDPNGMSGSPVFLIHDEGAPVQASDGYKAAGILIEYRAKDQLLLATDIGVALHLMEGLCRDGSA